jgi:hypothetical protein
MYSRIQFSIMCEFFIMLNELERIRIVNACNQLICGDDKE